MLAGLPLLLCAEPHWLNQHHDFGAFSEDLGAVDAEFKFVNDSDKPIRILDARATCGCTIPAFSKGDIAPGDTATLTVTYQATGRPGKFDKNVYVKTSNEPTVQRTLKVSGVVIGASATIKSRFPADGGKMKLQSSSAAFGEVKQGKLKTVYINMYNQSADTLHPLFEGLPDYVGAIISPAAVPPGQQAQAALTLNSLEANQWGILDADFSFKADKDEPAKPMSLFTIIMEDFDRLTPGQRMNAPICTAEPTRQDLGQVSRGDAPYTLEFKISNQGKSPLIIRRLQSVDPSITECTISRDKIKPGKDATVNLTFDPAKAESDFVNARISLITNDPENSLCVIRVTAEL